MPMILARLPFGTAVSLGLAVQLICALGVWTAGRWRPLALYLALVPLFCAAPFLLASGQCVACLDGALFGPVAFLCIVCFRRFIAPGPARGHFGD